MSDCVATNIPWLPSIPQDWKLGKVKQLFYISKEFSYKPNPVILSLARSGVKVRDISNNEGQLAANYDNYNSVQAGDLLLNPMDLYSGANCNVSYVNGVISPAYSNLRAKEQLEPRFFDFYFKVQYWTMAMFAHGKGVSFDNRWTLNADSLLNYEIPVPSYAEQKKAVTFLNEKISEIDGLITNQKKQIEKLEEYKQSLITKIVTKGLNPNVKMKDSGVEWIGEMPSKWDIVPTKRIFYIYSGATPASGDSKNFDGDISWITPADYKTSDVYVSCGRRNLSISGLNSCSAVMVPAETIVFSKRAPIGSVALAANELCTNQGCLSCVSKSRGDINPKYFYYCMSCATPFYELLGSGTTFKEISASKFSSFLLPLPPLTEQNSIVETLDETFSKVMSLVHLKENKIRMLQDYKKSLIYECATGKKRIAA